MLRRLQSSLNEEAWGGGGGGHSDRGEASPHRSHDTDIWLLTASDQSPRALSY